MGTFVTANAALPTARTNRPGTGAATQTYEWGATEANYAWNAADDLRTHTKGYLSLWDYSPTGDGVATDTTAVQSAVTAAVAAGVALFVPPGNYLCGQINITGPLRVFGLSNYASKFTMKTQTAGLGVPLFLVSGSNVAFENVGFDGNASAHANYATGEGRADTWAGRTYRSIIKVTGTTLSNISVRGCRFYRAYGVGVGCLDVEDVRIDNCDFDTCSVEGGFLYQDTNSLSSFYDNWQITNNRYNGGGSGFNTNATSSKNGGAFLMSYPRGFVFSGNVINTSGKCALKLEVPRDGVVTNNVARTGECFNFAAFQTQAGCKNVEFTGNSIYDYCHGFQILGDTGTGGEAIDTVTISGNTIKDLRTPTGGGDTSSDGIQVLSYSTSYNVTISGNSVKGAQRYGILLSGPFEELSVSGNTILSNNTAAATPVKYDVAAGGAATGNSGTVAIKGNVITNGGTTGATNGQIYITSSGGAVTAVLDLGGNTINAGATTNRGIYEDGQHVTAGALGDGYINGKIEIQSTTIGPFLGTCAGVVNNVGNWTTVPNTDATYTVPRNQVGLLVEPKAGGTTVTLPSSPQKWWEWTCIDVGGATANNITIKNSAAVTQATITSDGGSKTLLYNGSSFVVR